MNMHNPETSLELGRSLVRALTNTGISVLYQDPDLRVLWARNVPPAWAAGDLRGLTDADFLPASEADRTLAAKHAALDDGTPAGLEIRVPGADGPRWFKIWIDADRHNGGVRGVVTTAVDITEEKRREQTLRALLREVSHRSRNLLAIIQSVAAQTGRYSGSIETFLNRFRGRLQSLASSQDLVTSSNWRGAELHALLSGQIGRYVADPARAVRMEGVNPFLNPNAALHIGLAVHELAVNSVSYGALSRPDGSVTISAEFIAPEAGAADSPSMQLSWIERLPPGSQAFNAKRFGSVALERVVPASLGGKAELMLSDGLLSYRLFVPSTGFAAE
jgi:two-component sensor histidine kinase